MVSLLRHAVGHVVALFRPLSYKHHSTGVNIMYYIISAHSKCVNFMTILDLENK